MVIICKQWGVTMVIDITLMTGTKLCIIIVTMVMVKVFSSILARVPILNQWLVDLVLLICRRHFKFSKLVVMFTLLPIVMFFSMVFQIMGGMLIEIMMNRWFLLQVLV
uniref:Uncharacterized protein n=1 Tax=Cacopsylla melanoneura TaxID=428564 RepID=A0A8D8SG38_9HEMI